MSTTITIVAVGPPTPRQLTKPPLRVRKALATYHHLLYSSTLRAVGSSTKQQLETKLLPKAPRAITIPVRSELCRLSRWIGSLRAPTPHAALSVTRRSLRGSDFTHRLLRSTEAQFENKMTLWEGSRTNQQTIQKNHDRAKKVQLVPIYRPHHWEGAGNVES